MIRHDRDFIGDHFRFTEAIAFAVRTRYLAAHTDYGILQEPRSDFLVGRREYNDFAFSRFILQLHERHLGT